MKSFYDDQMTQHAAALTYYALMSLFPAVLLGISLLALIGQYPSTYDAILGYLRDVAPQSAIAPIDDSLRTAFRNKDTATTAVVLSVWWRSTARPACWKRAPGAERRVPVQQRAQLLAAQDDRRGVHVRAGRARARRRW